MWLKILIFSLAISGICTQDATIGCVYLNRGGHYPYTCSLNINNPEGFDEFSEIPGEHVEGLTNEDVRAIDVFSQTTTIIPQIICSQFPNLVYLSVVFSEVVTINEQSFAGCSALESTIILYNRIEEVPANTFRNNPNLRFIYLSNNNISTVHAEALAGSSAAHITMEFNALPAFDPTPFEQVNETLLSLSIFANFITELPSGGFANLRNLQWLDLTANEFQNVPNDAFEGLERLTLLYLIACNLRNPNPEWFNTMPRLEELHLELNEITTLQTGVFSGLRRLTNLHLSYNELSQITSAPFGGSLVNIEVLSVMHNQIFALHAFFFQSAQNLNSFELVGNTCSNMNHFNIQNERSETRDRLRRCFDNFGPEFISCTYQGSGGDYTCTLAVRNPLGNDFDEIGGEHLADRENVDVVRVSSFEANTRVIPEVLCRQFVNLQNVAIISSYVEELTEQGFAGCSMLERVDLSYNSITTVTDGAFRNNSQLREVNLRRNVINRIGFEAFSGSAIEILNLSDNEIFELNSAWFEPINATLRMLDLSNNRIAILYADNFANLRNLEEVILNRNFLYIVPADAFSSLTNAHTLGISNCGLMELNPEWFTNLQNLHTLYIASNSFVEFPVNIFNPLTSLNEIFFYGNRIVELNVESFGASIGSLTMLYGTSNNINTVDNEILVRGTSLQSLLLFNNLCTQWNFYNVANNVEIVREALSQCIGNFNETPRVMCAYEGGESGNEDYSCNLNAVNPGGIDTFEVVEGDHVGNNSDSDVVSIHTETSNILVVPSVLCRQFINLNRMNFMTSFIASLNYASFVNCQNLRSLTVVSNNISEIPALVFGGAPNLDMLILSSNRIRTISASAFAGTQIRHLDLSNNLLYQFDSMVYNEIGSTLNILRLGDNRIYSLPFRAFDSLPNLTELDLNHNRLSNIPSGTFAPLINLNILVLFDCGLRHLDEQWFRGLDNLFYLQLSENRISHLPENIFDLPMLESLGIAGNNLRILDSHSFGRSMNSLFDIDASNNRINAFDPHLFDNTTFLFGLQLEENICINNTFLEIPQYRGVFREYLNDCFERYESASASCEFSEDEAIYTCDLTITNNVDRLRFERIDGEHMEGRNDNYVNSIFAEGGFTRSIPNVLCQQFQYTESIVFVNHEVEEISLETFRNCEFLFHLNLAENRIETLQDGVFSGNVYLSSLNLALNRLESISPRAFEGTQIYNLDLEENRFYTFDPAPLMPIANHLAYLTLRHNLYRTLPRNAFVAFRNLRTIDLNGNRFNFIPSNAFRGLMSLYDLRIADCSVEEINYRWFDDLDNLFTLELDMNYIRELPIAAFDLPNLSSIGLARNRLTELNSNAFGRSLNTLATIRAENNRINAIDPVIIDNASQLFSLSLSGNVCVDVDFIEVQNITDTVREYLSGCFENFQNST